MYEHLFDLIHESSVNRSAAKSLINRIADADPKSQIVPAVRTGGMLKPLFSWMNDLRHRRTLSEIGIVPPVPTLAAQKSLTPTF